MATSAGQEQPIIGTRQVQTVIRLRDGETNMLAGLIQRQDSDSLSGVPGLSDIPGLRRVFGSTSQEHRETDIVVTITPRIIRIPDITEDDLITLWVGTEENMRLRGPARNAFGTGPFAGGPVDTDAAPTGGPTGGAGAGVARVTPSEEVQRDRERAAEEAEAGQPDRDQPGAPGEPSGEPSGTGLPGDQPGDEPPDEPGPDSRPAWSRHRAVSPARIRML